MDISIQSIADSQSMYTQGWAIKQSERGITMKFTLITIKDCTLLPDLAIYHKAEINMTTASLQACMSNFISISYPFDLRVEVDADI